MRTKKIAQTTERLIQRFLMQRLKWTVKEHLEQSLSQYKDELELLDDFFRAQVENIESKMEKAVLRKGKEVQVIEVYGSKLDHLGVPRDLVFKSPLLEKLKSELEDEGFHVREGSYGIPRIPGCTHFIDYVYTLVVELPEF